MAPEGLTAERKRLLEDAAGEGRWKFWGPYLAERQWGTVREDYSPGGDAWDDFSHEQARSRAYRWGEDGLAGISDDQQRLCLALALWNGRDAILKERLYGLTNGEGNHAEDVKELYYYLDATPTHSYLKFLYKYPQAQFPYAWLVEENGRRGFHDPEFELLDTGIFDADRYFDVVVEYAKAGPEDILMQITVANRGPDAAALHVIPQLWFRNTWAWRQGAGKPRLRAVGDATVGIDSRVFGSYRLHCDGAPELLFTENDSNTRRLWGQDAPGPFKDGFHDYLIAGDAGAVDPSRSGTKAGACYRLEVPARASVTLRLRLTAGGTGAPFADFDTVVAQRRADADAFYADIQSAVADADARAVQRQAFAGMIWSKQYFHIDIPAWLEGDATQVPPPAGRRHGRNTEWRHLNNADIISMPDTWEYPWYAAWDLAFHCLPLAMVDAEFAKQQLILLTREWYMHPNGQLPAYEWNFGDVNPPVHAWASWRVFQIDRQQRGDAGDLAFLERILHKLSLNFTWWVNRKDAEGRNVFQGGFLGLDNIGVFDRSAPLPTGGFINQADGTAWMAMYALNLMRIALELARHNHVYEDIATKYFEHFLAIAEAMTNIGGRGISLWDDADGFFYDVLSLPDGATVPLKVRSMVGLIPLFAVETLEPELLDELPGFRQRLHWYLKNRPQVAELVSHWQHPGRGERRLLSLLRGHRMKCLVRRMVDEAEFLSDFGVRALSKVHDRQPYLFDVHGQRLTVRYQPAESDSGLFGGNSNWRGPIWFPVNYLLIESLRKFHHYYGDDFLVECPTGSGTYLTLEQIADTLGERLARIFLKDAQGRRPVFGANEKQQRDPHFRDHLLFYEYFHGDNGRGVGASHQTGWTGLIAALLQPGGLECR
ncbi:MAG: glucosidase [Rhodospirillaceae bacterium]|nr:glucosidase [Rhodospirillaceae bacterium]